MWGVKMGQYLHFDIIRWDGQRFSDASPRYIQQEHKPSELFHLFLEEKNRKVRDLIGRKVDFSWYDDLPYEIGFPDEDEDEHVLDDWIPFTKDPVAIKESCEAVLQALSEHPEDFPVHFGFLEGPDITREGYPDHEGNWIVKVFINGELMDLRGGWSDEMEYHIRQRKEKEKRGDHVYALESDLPIGEIIECNKHVIGQNDPGELSRLLIRKMDHYEYWRSFLEAVIKTCEYAMGDGLYLMVQAG